MPNDIIKELNNFLKGNYMAIHTYDHYIHHMDDLHTKQILQQIQKKHKEHAAMVADRIQNLGGMPVHDVGMMGKVAEMTQTLKGSTKDDTDILKDAMVGEQRGIKKSREILDGDLDQESLSLVKYVLGEDEKNIELLDNLVH